MIELRDDEPICYRRPLCQLPLNKRAAQHFSHIMKPVKNKKKRSSTETNIKRKSISSRLLVLPECFAGRMFVTFDVALATMLLLLNAILCFFS